MVVGAHGRMRSSVWVLIALVAAPHVLGLVARVAPGILDRLMAWPRAEGLELLPVPVSILVVAVVVYVLLTPGRRRMQARQQSGSTGEGDRKLLPPLELVLLQVGNITFLAFAVILGIFVLAAIAHALRFLAASTLLSEHNFKLSLGLALIWALFALRPGALRKQSRDMLSQAWTGWPWILTVAVGCLGLVGALRGLGPLRIDLTSSELRPQTLVLLYLASGACLVVARLVAGAARARGSDENSSAPVARLMPVSVLAWAGCLGMGALYLNGAILTVIGHLLAL